MPRMDEGVKKSKTEYMLEKELEQVLQLLTVENRIVMRVAVHTGLRLGDVLALRTEQLRPNFWVTEQKTHKRRQVGLPQQLLEDIRANAGQVWAFPGRDPAKHRTRQAVWKDVKRAAKAMRLSQNVAPHSARKFYAVDLLQRYGDIERVRRALNHDNEIVTLIYAMADHQLRMKHSRRRGRPGGRRA